MASTTQIHHSSVRLVSLMLAGMMLGLPAPAQAFVHPDIFPASPTRQLQSWLQQDSSSLATPALLQLYQANGFQPVWMAANLPDQNAQQLLLALNETAADHWQPYHFDLDDIQAASQELQAAHQERTTVDDDFRIVEAVSRLDLLLSRACLRYIQLVNSGQLIPDSLQTDLGTLTVASRRYRSDFDSSLETLTNAVLKQQLPELLRQLTPQQPAYLAMRHELQRYQHLGSNHEWPPLLIPEHLQPGQQHPLVPALRQRLELLGDLPSDSDPDPAATNSYYFGTDLQTAISRFQQRQGLPVDGRPGSATLQRLNQTPEQLVRKIALNMKRLRLLPLTPPSRYILVNVPDYRLQLIEQGQQRLDMKVIVGQPQHPTPVITEAIKQLELAPTWGVPKRIAVEKLLPKIINDPFYLQAHDYLVFDRQQQLVDPQTVDWQNLGRGNFPYRLLQRPGPDNALGDVKFLLPNSQAIYLHDTSEPGLFKRRQRALSSGCIRVEKPLELAYQLLRDQYDWSPKRVTDTIRKGKPERLNLSVPVPVYLLYWTAWVDEHGTLQLRDDIYGRDRSAGITPSQLQARR